jgi:Protein of unknown function (DUF2569)
MRERLQSLTDHVLPADMSRYTTNLKKVRASLGQTTYWHDKKPVQPSNFNWIVAIFAGGVFLTCIGLAWHWYRYDPPNRLPIADSSLQGFGGWLILPTIGVFLAPLFGFRALIESLPSYGLDTWDTYTSTGNAAYHFLMAPLLLFELTFHLATIVFSVLLIVLFIQKRRSAPLVYIILFTCAAAFTIIDLIIALQVPSLVENVQAKDWGAAGKQVLAVVIWGFYFYRSRRVKATFVNEWNKNKPPNTNAVTHASS